MQLDYGTGSIDGILSEDSFFITDSFFVTDQQFILATYQDMNAQVYFDAIIGIGPNDLSNGFITLS